MPIKNLLYRFQPAPLYIVLILSICYFSVQLILSHLTHALTLLMASYHMLCNIFALAGSIITIKHNELHNDNGLKYSSSLTKVSTSLEDNGNKQIVPLGEKSENSDKEITVVQTPDAPEIKSREFKTRNTFGWARIEILTMLIVCITLASLSFSLLVEALQTLVHIDHQDTMHLPVHVMILGFVGLLLNGFTYYIIGGYTLHQGSFLHINPQNGQVIVEPSNISKTTGNGEKTLSVIQNSNSDHQLKEDLKSEGLKLHYHTRREGAAELMRDVCSTIFVIVCAVIVHFAQDTEHTAKFIDPILSIFSCVMLVGLSYPYMKESCLILLQTIPGNIDMDNFERTLVTKFPQIVSYHDLHIWQLSSHKYIATVHIIFQSPKLYAKTIDDVRSYFHDHSIAHVTIQPEFHTGNTINTTPSMECLMQCSKPECIDKVCCKDSMTDLREISVCPGGSDHEHSDKKSGGKSKKHGHSHDHGHGHGHSHGHKHEPKHKQKYGHEHSSDVTDEVPKVIVENSQEVKELPKIKATQSREDTQSDVTTPSPMTSEPLEVKNTSIEASEESSKNQTPTEKTDTTDLSQTKASELLTTVPSAETVDENQSTSDNTKC